MSSAEISSGKSAASLDKSKRGLIRVFVWLLLLALLARYAFIWADTFAGASLPHIGGIGFTAIFAAFSILHAAEIIGWRRALVFLGVCVLVSFAFESVGVATGLVYGPYHYGTALGAKIAGVPVIIPFAWFMMIYASWIVAHLLLEGAGSPASLAGVLARAVIAAMAMTAWDTLMDPGAAKAGAWVWENGGAYFGVPFQNYVGWMATTLAVYLVVALIFRAMARRPRPVTTRIYSGAPVLAYAIVALDQLLVVTIPELHIVAAFSMGFIALLALLRLLLGRGPIALPTD
jgi:putative membrane protein